MCGTKRLARRELGEKGIDYSFRNQKAPVAGGFEFFGLKFAAEPFGRDPKPFLRRQNHRSFP